MHEFILILIVNSYLTGFFYIYIFPDISQGLGFVYPRGNEKLLPLISGIIPYPALTVHEVILILMARSY